MVKLSLRHVQSLTRRCRLLQAEAGQLLAHLDAPRMALDEAWKARLKAWLKAYRVAFQAPSAKRAASPPARAAASASGASGGRAARAKAMRLYGLREREQMLTQQQQQQAGPRDSRSAAAGTAGAGLKRPKPASSSHSSSHSSGGVQHVNATHVGLSSGEWPGASSGAKKKSRHWSSSPVVQRVAGVIGFESFFAAKQQLPPPGSDAQPHAEQPQEQAPCASPCTGSGPSSSAAEEDAQSGSDATEQR
jgi:hypothetical protein